MRPVLFLGLLSVGCGVPTSDDGDGADGTTDTDDTTESVPWNDATFLIKPAAKQYDLPAIGGARVVNGDIEVLGTHGKRAQGHSEKVTDHDQWHLGSCTKAMTATLVAAHVEDGLLEWDTTIGEIFTDITVHPDLAGVPITWLLSHRAGTITDLGQHPAIFEALGDDRDMRDVRADFAAQVLALEPEFTPGDGWGYSNSGFIIAGAALERLTGDAWETLMLERLFTPLQMDSCGFGAPGDPELVDQPWGHSPTGTAIEPGVNADNPAGLGPAGTVNCSLESWSKFLSDQAAGARGEDALLTAVSYEMLHTSQGDDYALGWGVADRDWAGGKVLVHSGSNTIWMATTWVAPELNAAYMATTNIAAPDTAYALDDAITALIVDGPSL